MPVHSSAMSTPSSAAARPGRAQIAVTLIGPLPTSIVSPVTFTLPGSGHARVIAQQVGVGLDRAEIVDRDDLDVLAARLDDGAQTLRPMRPKPLMATRTAIFFPPLLRQPARRFRDRFGRDAEMLVEFRGLGRWRRSPSCRRTRPSIAEPALPAEAGRRPRGDTDRAVAAHDLAAVALVLRREQLQEGHGDHGGLLAFLREEIAGGEGELHFRARGDQADRCGLVAGQDVGALGAQVLVVAPRTVGRFCRVSVSTLGVGAWLRARSASTRRSPSRRRGGRPAGWAWRAAPPDARPAGGSGRPRRGRWNHGS
jgi:hypothetical protein